MSGALVTTRKETVRAAAPPAQWTADEVCAAAATGVASAEAALREEQAVRGIDSLDERAIQGLLADGLRTTGFGVFREERYPSDSARRRRSEGRRCHPVLDPG